MNCAPHRLPYIQNAEEAEEAEAVEAVEAAVRSIEYPSSGIRGVSALTRATRFGRVKNYAAECREQLCLLVQVETLEAIDQLESFASVKGVDGVFIGPGDLAASMGLLGQPGHADVVSKAITTIRRCGKPAGILTGDKAIARRCIELGTTFTAVGVDVGILATETTRLRESFALDIQSKSLYCVMNIGEYVVNKRAPGGLLKASINIGNPILAKLDATTGKPVGVSVDLALALAFAKRLGVAAELLVFDTAGKSVKAVSEGAADIGRFR